MNAKITTSSSFAIRTTHGLWVVVLQTILAASATSRAADGDPFDAEVLDVRPRVFLRDEPFEGLTIEKLRSRIGEPEFAGVSNKWRTRPLGRALRWMLEERQEDFDSALAGLKGMDAASGTWSDRGLALVRLATLFDWLYEGLDEPTRRETIRKIEQAADAAVLHVRSGQAPFYYSRTPSALAGLCIAGLALDGVSEKAEGYLETFREYGVDEYFRAYQWVDGAATGATYTLHYTYTALPSICAAWWSATDHNPADWIRAEQGDWLNGIVDFYLWYMRPGFAFTDINDQFRDNWQSHDEYCQGLDIASYVTGNGYGRSWSRRWFGRFGPALYHPSCAHNYIFRDTALASSRLAELPLARLFGRDSCGYGFFRSPWPEAGEPDLATHVFFRCGDPMDVHGGVAAGEFQVFKHVPLAARSGRYSNYDSPPDQYHRNCISANVILFTDSKVADDRGDQQTRRGMKTDHKTWNEWIRIRDRFQMDVARILHWQVGPRESRCRADLTKTNPQSKCQQWIREFVWLENEHLVVLDVVRTTSPDIRHQWQLHAANRPVIGDRLFTVTNRPPNQGWADPGLKPKNREARLFCQTLLPRNYRMILHDNGEVEVFKPTGERLGQAPGDAFHREYGQQVVQIEPEIGRTRTVFLHVLTAVDSADLIPPKVTYRLVQNRQIEVSVDGATTNLAVPTWFVQTR